eukprot:gnl/TRDRNA2_/TRDRNA2_186026_c0_seq1.p1 gnl/TRDRNA2_/TRDRNA2_186026_c0~~gnl/TRDRNA2_/TRDRNA2_186026_c0_seq1.p1  ORF type:complete len:220 (-),score=18.08 gnl/TRDRNA2_/TRDRNA2_186026_c0_seq1:255-914(-)
MPLAREMLRLPLLVVMPTLAMMVLCLHTAHAVRARHVRGTAAATAGSRSVHRERGLPKACDTCGSSSASCNKMHDQCSCCKGILEDRKSQLCSPFGTQGRSTCLANIRAATKDKQAFCKEKQGKQDAIYRLRRLQIEDALGFHLVSEGDGLGLGMNSTTSLGPYSDHCEGHQDPSCGDNDALCSQGGCNQQLWLLDDEYSRLNAYKGLHDNIACFQGTR